MKGKLLFFLKGVGLSIGLFVFWRPISRVYGFILNLLLSQYHPLYHLLKRNEQFPYIESLLLIPFIALTIATPKISILKKAVTIGIMVAAFLLIDFVAVLLTIDRISNNPAAFMTYRSVKMFVPFVIWLMVSSPYVFRRYAAGNARHTYACPICKGVYRDIKGHIQEAHGEKSLSKEKGKRFISENPEITV